MTLVTLPHARTAGANPAEKITVTLGDKTFQAGRRTAAHLEDTIARLSKLRPDAHLHVMQPCYNTGYAPSAGTHDGDGVLDLSVPGLAWLDAQSFLRKCGWAAWWRHTGSWASSSTWHIHMVSIGCPGPVGIYVPAQVDDYYRHAQGLAGQHTSGDDPTWHPADIDSTIFDYPAWLNDLEANMPLNDADKKWIADTIDASVTKNVTAVVEAAVATTDDRTTRIAQMVRRLGNGLKIAVDDPKAPK